MSYENFKKKYRFQLFIKYRYGDSKSSINSKDTIGRPQESIRTRAKRFIENDLCFQYKIEDILKKRKKIAFPNKRNMRNSYERIKNHQFSDTSFCTEGADSSHFDKYFIGKRIGQGAYAVVRAGIETQSNRKVAIKIYDKKNLKDSQKRKGVRREIKLLERMNHEGIINLFEAFDNKKQVFLVMENICGGSLHSLLKSQPKRQLKESEAKILFGKVACAVKYCHSKNITHRDIKLENILLDENKSNVKLIDFGFSTWIPNDKKIKIFWGTPSYMAPEIVSKKEFWGPPADIWALGVLLYALLWGEFPFKGKSDQELYARINQGTLEIPNHVSLLAKSLINKMIVFDPEKRISASEIWKDPWLTNQDAFFKEVYKINGNISNLSTLNSKPESRRTTLMETSPYRDIDSGKNTDMPYEAYFPWDNRKISKEN